MADREIKITFPEVKMEALAFFLQEANTKVETVLLEHLDKTYEKMVPAPVRKFVESKLDNPRVIEAQEEGQRSTNDNSRPRGRRPRQERSQMEHINEQTAEESVNVEEQAREVTEQEEANGMVMSM